MDNRDLCTTCMFYEDCVYEVENNDSGYGRLAACCFYSESVKPKPEDLKTIIETNFAIDKEWQDRIGKLGFHKKG